jgi:hypothetical protein
MSYEGYTQCICESGHYYTRDAFDEDRVCCECGRPAAWSNEVDETNEPDDGKILYSALVRNFLAFHAQVETCNLGHEHEISPDIFRIPTREETRPLRCTFVSANGKPRRVLCCEYEQAAREIAKADGRSEPEWRDYDAVDCSKLKDQGSE